MNTADLASIPTWLTDWPCNLLIVIAKQNRTGNCTRRSLNGTWASLGMIPMWGMKISFVACSPVRSWTSRTRGVARVKIPILSSENNIPVSLWLILTARQNYCNLIWDGCWKIVVTMIMGFVKMKSNITVLVWVLCMSICACLYHWTSGCLRQSISWSFCIVGQWRVLLAWCPIQ